MKVFAMNECDWMAGEDLESCIREYMAEYRQGESRDEALDEPRELTDVEMDKFRFVEEMGDPGSETRSFREQLERMILHGQHFPAFFASTEY